MIAAYSFYFGPYSWAAHARGFLSALHSLEGVALIPWDDPKDPGRLSPQEREMVELGKRYRGDGTALAIGPIERMSWARGARRIGFVVWETTRLLAHKIAQLREMDELWTPSRWSKEILAQNGLDEARIRVVPEGVNIEVFRPMASVRDGRPFRFLAVGKWEARKGIDLLVAAFCEAFQPWEAVELVLHCFNPYLPGFSFTQHIRAAASGPHAPIIASGASEHSSTAELIALYNSCDAFVLPTRAEGWGLPIMEAMACGLPPIITDYSAPREYLDAEIAWLIPVKQMVEVYDPVFYPSGVGCWAEPDRAELKRILQYVFHHPEEAREKGRRARARVVERWTWHHAAEVAQAHCALPGREAEMPR